MMPKRATDQRDAVPSSMRSVERVLAMLALFAESEDEVAAEDIRRALNIPRSTCFRLLKCLVDARFIERLDQGYTIGPLARKLGGQPWQHQYLRRLFAHRIRAASEVSHKTVNLNVLHRDNYRLCILQVHSSFQEIRHYTPLETPLPLYVGSAGKCIWAHLPEELRTEIYETNAAMIALPREEQFAQLDLFRAQGYAVSRGERVSGVSSVSIPLFGREGELLGSLTMSEVTQLFPLEDVPRCIATLRQLAAEALPA